MSFRCTDTEISNQWLECQPSSGPFPSSAKSVATRLAKSLDEVAPSIRDHFPRAVGSDSRKASGPGLSVSKFTPLCKVATKVVTAATNTIAPAHRLLTSRHRKWRPFNHVGRFAVPTCYKRQFTAASVWFLETYCVGYLMLNMAPLRLSCERTSRFKRWSGGVET